MNHYLYESLFSFLSTKDISDKSFLFTFIKNLIDYKCSVNKSH